MSRTDVRKLDGQWKATCPSCPWTYRSKSLPSAHTEATHHTCTPILGPRWLMPGTVISDGTSIAVAVRDPRDAWWSTKSEKRPEVW